MRKEPTDISDNSSSLMILAKSTTGIGKPMQRQKSQLEICIDALLGELSEIKAENGITGDSVQPVSLQQHSSVHFNVLEGHSSVIDATCAVPEESASELASEIVGQIITEEEICVDESSALQESASIHDTTAKSVFRENE